MKILTAAQMRRIDQLSIDKFGIPSLLLMENAGMRVVEALEAQFDDLEDLSIGVLCGKGNNGGDGFVVARQLINKGCNPIVFLLGEESDVKGDAKINLDILKAAGHWPTTIASERDWESARIELGDATILVDALLGTGLTKPASGLYRAVIHSISNDFPRATIVSIDLPSGLPADSACPIGPAVEADLTVTFTALKPCLVLAPSHEHAGDVMVANIGNPPELLEAEDLKLNLISSDTFPAVLARRSEDTNKGDFGKALIIGGSRGKSGAALMAGQAALRAGAGLVTVATAASVLPVVASAMPELMTEPLLETDVGTIAMQSIAPLLEGKTVLGLGPGMTAHPETRRFIRAAVREAGIPVVIDADGLNAFLDALDELRGGSLHDHAGAVVITPHPGEMARLIGKEIPFVTANRVEVATEFAASHGLYVVLKGFRTVIATPAGDVFINPTGNPGMATGGTGDILTGLIVGAIAQKSLGNLTEQLCLAVYLHGAAGDLAAEQLGEETLVATDILQFLGKAWEQLRQ